MAKIDPEIAEINKWFQPLFAALKNLPDDQVCEGISSAAAEAKRRGLLSEIRWKAICAASNDQGFENYHGKEALPCPWPDDRTAFWDPTRKAWSRVKPGQGEVTDMAKRKGKKKGC